ncbi:carboxypeptidase regulatory-like domain-containing protein [Candidatus Sumerlaeota bacterium]|nr:carboxypeptidase regulatory-like domain-containing protein [Candidatus Sumerlaeota bacterium]
MTDRNWTPEEIAALVEDLVEDAADRERLEEAVRSDPEARAWAEALRRDREYLDAVFEAKLEQTPAEEFNRRVLARIDQGDPSAWQLFIAALGRRWRPLAVSLTALMAVIVIIALPDRRPEPVEEIALVPESIATPQEPAPEEEGIAWADQIRGTVVDRELMEEESVEEFNFDAPAIGEPLGNAVLADTFTLEMQEMPALEQAAPAAMATPSPPPAPARVTGPAVRGQVTDASGAPLAEATVALLARIPTEPVAETRLLDIAVTDFAGNYNFIDPFALAEEQGLRGRILYAEANHPGHAPVRRELSDTAPAQEIAFALPDAQPLRGQVVDPTGQPVEGVIVRAMSLGDGVAGLAIASAAAPIETETAEDGSFRFPNLVAGRQALTLRRDDSVPLPVGEFDTRETDQVALVWSGHDDFAITGQVVGALGAQPIAGARVHLGSASTPSAETDRLARVFTDSAGSFHFGGLSADQWYFVETDPPLMSLLGTEEAVLSNRVAGIRLNEEQPTADVLLLGQEQITVAGRAIDIATGEGVPDLTISLGRRIEPVLTDAEGTFTSGAMELGSSIEITLESPTWTLAEANSFAMPLRQSVELDIGAEASIEPLSVPVQRGVTLEGEVHDMRGLPIESAAIHGVEIAQGTGLSTALAHTDTYGYFATAIPPDQRELALFARAEGWPLAAAPETASGEAIPEEPIQITLSAADRRITGQVVDAQGFPRSEVFVMVEPMLPLGPHRDPMLLCDPGTSLSMITGGDGRFELVGLPSTPIQITARTATAERTEIIDPSEAVDGVIERVISLN